MVSPPSIARGRRSFLWMLAAILLLEGCATGLARGPLPSAAISSRASAARGRMDAPGSGGGFPEQRADPFQQLQEASGLEPERRHPSGAALYPAQARELWRQMLKTPVTWRNQAPRQSLAWLLREALAGDMRVEYADLRWRAERFESLVLLRADGYLVNALTGTPLQRLGALELREGEWWVGGLQVGSFYFSRGGVFYATTKALRRAPGDPLAELGLEHDAANAALDGVQEAMGELALALGHSIRHPIRSIADLTQLPTILAQLIASSPEYFAHYGALSREEQIREAARLSTHLLMLLGGGEAGAVGGISGWGAKLPLLSLTGKGELLVGGAMAAEGAVAATTLTVDTRALSILYMAGKGQGSRGGRSGGSQQTGQPAPPPGPGRLIYKTPTTESKPALAYQEQITQRPAWQVYQVGDVEFDGFNGIELQEAKGPSYQKFLKKDGTLQPWFFNGEGFQSLLDQARKQSRLARNLNLPLVWYVAEEAFANFLRQLFDERGWDNIEIRYVPPT